MADVVEAELFSLLFQRRDQTFVEADRGAAFPADNMVMVVTGLLRKVESLARQNDPLNQAGLAEGFQNTVNGRPVADLRPHLGENLLRGEGGGGLFQGLENRAAAGGGLQAGPAQGIFFSRVAMTHG